MSQVMATVDQEPNQIQAVPCEGISVRQVEFGFGIKSAPLGERPWMNPTQLISLPESFCEWKMITSTTFIKANYLKFIEGSISTK